MFALNNDTADSKINDIERHISAHLSDCLAEEGLTITRDKHENSVRTLIEMTTRMPGRDDKGDGLYRFGNTIRPAAAG